MSHSALLLLLGLAGRHLLERGGRFRIVNALAALLRDLRDLVSRRAFSLLGSPLRLRLRQCNETLALLRAASVLAILLGLDPPVPFLALFESPMLLASHVIHPCSHLVGARKGARLRNAVSRLASLHVDAV